MALDDVVFQDETAAGVRSSFAPGAAETSTLADAMAIDLTIGVNDAYEMAEAQTMSPRRVNALANSRTRDTSLPVGDGSALSPFEFDDDGDDEQQAVLGAVEEEEGQEPLEQTHRLVPIQTGYVYDPRMMLHVHPANEGEDEDDEDGDSSPHPEAPQRITAIYNKMLSNGCLKMMKKIKIREATKAETMLVHVEEVWDSVEQTQLFAPDTYLAKTRELEPRYSLYINQSSALCARLSCGGVMEMCDAVANGTVRNGFAIVRPPGHHAEPMNAMGFCFYNNVAVAARYLQEKYAHVDGPTRCKRIMILDWDVHHGNGTQKAFWDNPDVLYVSVHRFDDGTFYPGSMEANFDYVGGDGESLGRNVNIPWPKEGMGDGEYIAAFQRIVMPIAVEFAPDLVIVSAGFDAAAGDQLGKCLVTPAGYAHMTYLLASLARGRLVVALEGGYNLDAIANSALEVTKVLLGDAPIALRTPLVCDIHADTALRAVEAAHSPYWKCMRKPDYRARPEEDAKLPRVTLPELLAQHRRYALAKKYKLIEVPMSADPTGTSTIRARGSCLCTSDLLDESPKRRAIMLCVHDFGNVRLHAQSYMPADVATRKEQVLSIVDSSTSMIEWAQKGDMAVIDLSLLNSEAPSDPDAAIIAAAARRRQAQGRQNGRSTSEQEAHQHLDALLHVWDNLVRLLPKYNDAEQPDVVLFGFGSGCQAVASLLDVRPVAGIVKSVIQLPCYAQPPTIPKGDLRKWYYRRSRVFLPHAHSLIETEEDVVDRTKRFGQLIRSREPYPLRVFDAEIETITAFVEEALRVKTALGGIGTNVDGASTSLR